MNYTKQPKKMLIVNILNILRRYTDESHRLSQKDIGELLEREYGMRADRKSIRRNLTDLIDYGYPLEYSESIRKTKDGGEETILTDWYIAREFDDSELRLLIDSLLFSKHIPYNQCKDLVEKLAGLSNIYFDSKVRHIRSLPVSRVQNNQLFYTVSTLDEAISKGRKVVFKYADIGTDGKAHCREYGGVPHEYVVNPYQMVAANGRYYLICNHDNHDNVSNIRVDRILEISISDEPVKSHKKVRGMENGFDLPKHMAEHIYMFSGDSVKVTFRANRQIIGDIWDWFGGGVKFSNETADTVDVRVTVNRLAMRCWALQYGEYVEVMEPADFREEVKQAVLGVANRY